MELATARSVDCAHVAVRYLPFFFWLIALPAADLDVLLKRPSRSTFDAVDADFLLVPIVEPPQLAC
jgi:hypothetical protein